MTDAQQKLINMVSFEISNALCNSEHQRHKEGGDIDKIEAYMESYLSRVKLLREIRIKLEIEFTTIHYDPR